MQTKVNIHLGRVQFSISVKYKDDELKGSPQKKQQVAAV